MKKGTRVKTPHGLGTIIEREPMQRVERYIVELDDKSQFDFTPAYFREDIKPVSEKSGDNTLTLF